MNDKERGKLAARSGIWFVVSSIIVKLTLLITTPIFTRVLTKAEFGTVSTFTSWYSLLIAFCMLDLTTSTGRAKLDFPGKLREYVGSLQLLAAIVTGLIIAVASGFFMKLTRLLELDSFETILLGLYLFFAPAIQFHQLMYKYEYKYKQNIAIALYTTFSSVAISLILIYGFQGNNEHYRILGIVLPTIFLSLYFWISLILKKEIRVNWEYWKYGLKIGVPMVFHKVAGGVLAQSDRIFITKFQGTEQTALYSLVYNYSLVITTVTSAIADGWLPWFHDTFFEKKYDQIKRNVKPLVILGCYIALASIAFAPEAIMFLGGKNYMEGIYCVPPIVMGVVCQYIYTHYVNIEIHLKKTYFVSSGTTIAALANLLLNWIFVPRYGFVAAAYTTLTSYAILMFSHYIITSKVLKIKLYDDWFMFGSVAVVAVVSILLQWSYDYQYIRYILIVLGFISFLYYFRGYIKGFISDRKIKKAK